MSAHAFNALRGPIIVMGEATGPARTTTLKLLMDTGATTTVINLATVRYLGIDPSQPVRQVHMATGSAVGTAPLIVLTRLTALGQHRFGFPVVAHALPAASGVDGLLGLDFFRGHVLTIDFPAGQIVLS